MARSRAHGLVSLAGVHNQTHLVQSVVRPLSLSDEPFVYYPR
jgi:hypothetical protein